MVRLDLLGNILEQCALRHFVGKMKICSFPTIIWVKNCKMILCSCFKLYPFSLYWFCFELTFFFSLEGTWCHAPMHSTHSKPDEWQLGRIAIYVAVVKLNELSSSIMRVTSMTTIHKASFLLWDNQGLFCDSKSGTVL